VQAMLLKMCRRCCSDVQAMLPKMWCRRCCRSAGYAAENVQAMLQ